MWSKRHAEILANLLNVLQFWEEELGSIYLQHFCIGKAFHLKPSWSKEPNLFFCKFLPSAETQEHHLAWTLSYYQQINVRVKTRKIICYLNVQWMHHPHLTALLNDAGKQTDEWGQSLSGCITLCLWIFSLLKFTKKDLMVPSFYLTNIINMALGLWLSTIILA